MGRPTKLTPELQEAICKGLSSGGYIETAAQCAGIGTSTLQEWMARGADGESPYAEFAAAVKAARASAEAELLQRVKDAAWPLDGEKGQWQAASWILERSRPERYARREKIEQTTKMTIETLSDEDLDKQLKDVQAQLAKVLK